MENIQPTEKSQPLVIHDTSRGFHYYCKQCDEYVSRHTWERHLKTCNQDDHQRQRKLPNHKVHSEEMDEMDEMDETASTDVDGSESKV